MVKCHRQPVFGGDVENVLEPGAVGWCVLIAADLASYRYFAQRLELSRFRLLADFLDETLFLAGPAKILKGDAGRDPAGIFAGEFQGVVVRPAVLAFHPQQDHVDVIAVHGLDRAVGTGVLALEVTVAVGNDPPIRRSGSFVLDNGGWRRFGFLRTVPRFSG